MNKRIEILMHYAGYMTALVVFAVYMFVMWRFTKMDVLEIVATYGIFLYIPSIALPYLIVGEVGNEKEDE